MQFGQLELFAEEVLETLARSQGTKSQRLYFAKDDEWYVWGADEPVDGVKRAVLERAKRWGLDGGREPKSTTDYHYLSELDVVLEIECVRPSRAESRSARALTIGRAQDRSSLRFRAEHDSLTGLSNRAAFETAFGRHLRDSAATVVPGPEAALKGSGIGNALAQAASVCVVTVDLDHFKLVNDRFGHDYGDIVLFVAAQRLRRIATSFSNRRADLEVLLARPGGEEFTLAVLGAYSHDELRQLCRELVECAGEAGPLPTEREWADCPAEFATSVLRLPPPHERRVTSSVGVSSSLPLHQARDADGGHFLRLRRESDVAVYRAKADGRARARFFSEILAQHGAVLERHAATGIVTVDLGRMVGVATGQEFLVFHQDFTGDQEFVFSDGRTQRSLGKRPRRSCGRLSVFETLEEVAYCEIVGEAPPGVIVAGARLEHVHLGSIGHLTRAESREVDAESYRKSTRDFIDTRGGKRAGTTAAVLLLDNVAEMQRKHGVALVNDCLDGRPGRAAV